MHCGLLRAITFASPLLLAMGSAHAGVRVCNNSNASAWVALAMHQTASGFPLDLNRSFGWYETQPGECKIILDQPLATDGSFDYYALVRDSSGFWDTVNTTDNTSPTSLSFCYKSPDDFDQSFLESDRFTSGCEQHAYFKLETDRHPDFTIGLEPRG